MCWKKRETRSNDAKQLTRPPKEAPTIKIFGFVAPPEKFAVKSPRRSSPCLVSARTGVASHMAGKKNRDLRFGVCNVFQNTDCGQILCSLAGLGGPGGCGRTGRNVQGELPV